MPRPTYVDPFSLTDPIPKNAFQLRLNQTHCMDAEMYFMTVPGECNSSKRSQLWTLDENKRLKNILRQACIDFDSEWKTADTAPVNFRTALAPCHDQKRQEWDINDNRIHSAMNKSWVLVHSLGKFQRDLYGCTGYEMQLFDPHAEHQKWYKLGE